MSADSLPVELWDDIASHLPKVHNNKHDLISLSRTNRELGALCLPHIFADVQATFLQLDETFENLRKDPQSCWSHSFTGTDRWTLRPGRHDPPTLTAFERFLHGSPHIASMVSLLTLEPERWDSSSSTEDSFSRRPVNPQVFLSILHSLPKLQGLQIRHINLIGTSEEISTVVSNSEHGGVSLKHLWITAMRTVGLNDGDIRRLVDLLRLFKRVDDFRISNALDLYEQGSYYLPSQLEIHTVYLRGWAPTTGTLRALASHPQLHMLQSIDIDDQSFGLKGTEIPQLISMLRVAGSQLHHLAFGLETLVDSTLNAGKIPEDVVMNDIWSRCPNLRSFGLNPFIRVGPYELCNVSITAFVATAARMIKAAPFSGSLQTFRLQFNICTTTSVGLYTAEKVLADLEQYKAAFNDVDEALIALDGRIRISVEVCPQWSQPSQSNHEDVRDLCIARMLPRSWNRVRRPPPEPWPYIWED